MQPKAVDVITASRDRLVNMQPWEELADGDASIDDWSMIGLRGTKRTSPLSS
jgi:hypothetical protein